MSCNGENVYYKPEAHGLTILETVERPDMSYEFDMFVVFLREADGAILVGQDSGCSCPSPFEDTSVDELLHVTNMDEFDAAFNTWNDTFNNMTKVDAELRQSLRRKVRRRLAKAAV